MAKLFCGLSMEIAAHRQSFPPVSPSFPLFIFKLGDVGVGYGFSVVYSVASWVVGLWPLAVVDSFGRLALNFDAYHLHCGWSCYNLQINMLVFGLSPELRRFGYVITALLTAGRHGAGARDL